MLSEALSYTPICEEATLRKARFGVVCSTQSVWAKDLAQTGESAPATRRRPLIE
jgi:hypothetical protein